MATAPDELKKQLTFRKFRDGEQKYTNFQQAIFEADHSHKCPVYVHRTPPCQGSCPSGEDIRGWLQIVRGIEKPPKDMSWQEYAFRRATDANPFPAIMGLARLPARMAATATTLRTSSASTPLNNSSVIRRSGRTISFRQRQR